MKDRTRPRVPADPGLSPGPRTSRLPLGPHPDTLIRPQAARSSAGCRAGHRRRRGVDRVGLDGPSSRNAPRRTIIGDLATTKICAPVMLPTTNRCLRAVGKRTLPRLRGNLRSGQAPFKAYRRAKSAGRNSTDPRRDMGDLCDRTTISGLAMGPSPDKDFRSPWRSDVGLIRQQDNHATYDSLIA